jgi:DEAD/DEAH box helicase domain-containing protein
MLPSVVASELEQVARDALQTAFHPTTPGFKGLIDRFLADRQRLVKGPFITAALPFQQGRRQDWFPAIPLPFPPYLHQEKAYERLQPGSPQNTLVATGTGSGKTECFLLPVLEHCRQQLAIGQKGIKAILIYPMNALATDQAKRIAQLVHDSPELAGLRAGLYVGAKDDDPTIAMSAEGVITDKGALQKAPPDILLTNYKQLDYLLIQPQVQGLWAHNTAGVLRYLVVDEFHTFDGAQGTDLACLIRRLRDRLGCPGDELICVGTSATLGGPEAESKAEMLSYAGQIFASRFEPSALIEEDRIGLATFFQDNTNAGEEGLLMLPLPALEQLDQLDPANASNPQAYLAAQAALWLADALPPPPAGKSDDPQWRLALGRQLGTLPAVQNLVRLAAATASTDELLERFAKQLGLGDRYPLRFRLLLLESLLALMAHARSAVSSLDGTKAVAPWLQLRVQLWLRELKRMVATVGPTPELLHSDDLDSNDAAIHLPVVHCRDCGGTAWASTLLNQGSPRLDRCNDLSAFYRAFFARDPLLRFVYPLGSYPLDGPPSTNNPNPNHRVLCSDCLTLHNPVDTGTNCLSCQSTALLLVEMPHELVVDSNNHQRTSTDCPQCGAHRGLLLVGSSAANFTSSWSASLFASPFNGDKKLLAFSDSVQDAAHRAGFIAARAYRTSFRTALTQVVQQHPPDQHLSLPELQRQFLSDWQQELPKPVDFVATFLPSDLEWLKEWDDLQQQDQPELPADSPLLEIVRNRLGWEICAEFGYRSRLGSSVEQAGALAAAINPARLNGLIPGLLAQLQNEVEPLRFVSSAALRRFLIGFLHHLRQRGAIPTPELVGRDEKGTQYLGSGGRETYLFNQIQYTPNFGGSASKPIFLTSHRGQGDFEQLVRETGQPTWSQHWLSKTLAADSILDAEQQKESLHAITAALCTALVLQEFPGGRTERVWGLRPDAITVAAEPTVLRCGRCGDSQSIPTDQLDHWQAMPCLVRHCRGHYEADPRGGLPLYQRLYQTGQVHRIVAREHTGLLSRPDRERLENHFIRKQFRSDPNLLSATSTLEMGINIGDLSTVLLGSVPPEPANYLQRVGRAGRRDGNALVGTLVTGTPHDLYFYGDPREMLQGRVSPPGCYLDAAAILKRQLIAFSLDRWVQSDITIDALPKRLKPVLDAVAAAGADTPRARFPYPWLDWTRQHQGSLLEAFLLLFPDLSEATRQELAREFLATGDRDDAPYAMELIRRIGDLINERKRLVSESRKLKKRYEELAAKPEAMLQESELRTKAEIRREQLAYADLAKDLNKRPLLQLLTDEGFLPNYAFPEAGVTLKSVLWRKLTNKPATGRRSEELKPLSYERPGSVAIRELVPDGVFYAQGRRVKVDQVDPTLNKAEPWRFCPSCSFTCKHTDAAFSASSCPRCGDSLYADSQQVKEMARLKLVQATTEDRRSRFGDDVDERNPTFFQRELLILPDLQRAEISLAVDDVEFPFGVEYLASTSFREINFGERAPIGSQHSIAGKTLGVRGFEICRTCGKVQNGPSSARQHTYSCRYRDNPDNAQSRQLLFMYREFSSEALRFLLPDRQFWDDSGQPSFVAALQLGLKRHFGGKVDHLLAAIGDEPQSGSQQRRTFLYLYDSVPGGTGYLRELVDQGGDSLHQVLKKAQGALQACGCVDGCYRCVYAYRRRFQRDRTSKHRALDQLQAILGRWKGLGKRDRSLSEITITSQVESELEQRFLDALVEGKGAPSGIPVSLRKELIHGREAYLLKVGATNWKLELQKDLGEAQGVEEFSRADFLLTPTAGGKPIAVYTDGWDYHRSRLTDDVRQRMALHHSGRYRFWSLTWDDVVGKPASSQHPLKLNGLLPGQGTTIATNPEPLLRRWLSTGNFPEGKEVATRDLKRFQALNSLQLLMAYLAEPDERAWHGLAQILCLAQLGNQPTAITAQAIADQISGLMVVDHVSDWQQVPRPNQLGFAVELAPGLQLLNLVDAVRHEQRLSTASFRILHLDPGCADIDIEQQNAWREWLRQGNLFQFLPYLLLSTPGYGGSEQTPTDVAGDPVGTSASTDPQAAAFAEECEKALQLTDPSCRDLLRALQVPLRSAGLSQPSQGYALEGSRGEVLAEAEFAWADQQIAVLIECADGPSFTSAGWRVFAAPGPEALQNPEGLPLATATALLQALGVERP